MTKEDRFPPDPTIDKTIKCEDLDRSVSALLEDQGYRLFSIFPADSPRWAILERDGHFIRLEKQSDEYPVKAGESRRKELVISGVAGTVWHEGRAGMRYRDLVPGRMDGKLIASHIRIENGGPVPDYVHFHRVDFQVIFCIKGWCRLVYEDQGEPFMFEEGDCVLQPPGIRHRVIECSDGFEVVELSSPAEHPTYAEHGFGLPTEARNGDRIFSGQKFLHVKFREQNEVSQAEGISIRRTGIREASAGAVGVDVVTIPDSPASPLTLTCLGNTFLFLMTGSVEIDDKVRDLHLSAGDSAMIGGAFKVRSSVPGTRILMFTL
jgi:quercetin dioxygenase-like cupin family protein